MAIKFQYNKTALNALSKQLKMRQRALPTLQNKESALRLEVRKAKADSDKLEQELKEALDRYDYMASLWNEFDAGLITITDVDCNIVKVAGVKIPKLNKINYDIKDFNSFIKPAWYVDGIKILKDLTRLGIEAEFCREKAKIIDYNRKKTTQKVNLYEKVQIPGYIEAMRKIKRYLEDEENLSKASLKIVKTRHEQEEEAEL